MTCLTLLSLLGHPSTENPSVFNAVKDVMREHNEIRIVEIDREYVFRLKQLINSIPGIVVGSMECGEMCAMTVRKIYGGE